MQARIFRAIHRLHLLYQQHFMQSVSLHLAAVRGDRVVIGWRHVVLYCTVQYSKFATKVFQTQGDFMDRRNFLSGSLAASALSLATAGELAAQAGSPADQSAPEYMDLRRYH